MVVVAEFTLPRRKIKKTKKRYNKNCERKDEWIEEYQYWIAQVKPPPFCPNFCIELLRRYEGSLLRRNLPGRQWFGRL